MRKKPVEKLPNPSYPNKEDVINAAKDITVFEKACVAATVATLIVSMSACEAERNGAGDLFDHVLFPINTEETVIDGEVSIYTEPTSTTTPTETYMGIVPYESTTPTYIEGGMEWVTPTPTPIEIQGEMEYYPEDATTLANTNM